VETERRWQETNSYCRRNRGGFTALVNQGSATWTWRIIKSEVISSWHRRSSFASLEADIAGNVYQQSLLSDIF
jgi:hypothetical protein